MNDYMTKIFTYRPSSYQIFENNCNNFSNEIALFLTGNGIPDEILNLPNDFLSTYVLHVFLVLFI